MQYDEKGRVLKQEVDADFWNYVADKYSQLRNEGYGAYGARDIIAETIFGSP